MRVFGREIGWNRYGMLLGKVCWANFPTSHSRDRLGKYKIIAVSWKGGICLRRWNDDSGEHGKWIKKEEVKDRVWFKWSDIPDDMKRKKEKWV